MESSSPRPGGIRFLTPAQMHSIHLAALRILQEPGLEIELPGRMYSRLSGEEGVKADPDSRRVRLEPGPVLETIRQMTGAASCRIDENGTDKPAQPLRFPGKIIGQIGNSHGFVFDVEKGVTRPASHDDARDFIKLRRALPGVIKTNIGLLPQDVPREVMWIHASAMNVIYQDGGGTDCNDMSDGIWIGRILQAAGKLEKAEDYATTPYTSGPLRVEGRSSGIIVHQLGQGRLPRVSTMGFLGGSSPVTLAATIATVFAEIFGFNTITRLLCNGANRQFSPQELSCDQGMLDPRRGHTVGSRPENQLLRSMMGQMSGEFYKAPDGRGFIISAGTDAAEPGIQAAMENALGAAVELCKGFYSCREDITVNIKSLGRLQGNLCICPELALVDYEAMRWLQKFASGITVDENTLALNAVSEVGPGGSYLSCAHTLENYRALWAPELLHEGPWQVWADGGRRSPLDIAGERIEEIFKGEEPAPAIPDRTASEVRKLVEEAERELLGKVTGVRV